MEELTMAEAERYLTDKIPDEDVDVEIREVFLELWTHAALSNKYSRTRWGYLRNLLERKGIHI